MDPPKPETAATFWSAELNSNLRNIGIWRKQIVGETILVKAFGREMEQERGDGLRVEAIEIA